ncbi:MAG: hypothetical protein U5N26_03190 [Candidatus Marinimicrobia bacterium]|nr:hypothetical protein [Candidatus Neomarinimicrobiota bacterium]
MHRPRKDLFLHTGLQVESGGTAALENAAEAKGYRIVPFSEISDVMVVNSCTVTGRADRKTRQALYQAKRRSPEGTLVLMGCYPQVDPGRSPQISGVDIVLGTRDKFDLFPVIEKHRQTEGNMC